MNPFSNTETAFQLKSNQDLKKAKFLFLCIEKPALTKFGTVFLNTAMKYNFPFAKGIVKDTLFRHFCGGETMQKCIPVIQNMYSKGVSSILDYSVEGKEEEATFDHTVQETVKIINFAADNPAIPFSVFKPTGFGRLGLYEKAGSQQLLSDSEKEEWQRVCNRYYQVCELSHTLGLPIMIDAEESWMQTAVDDLTEELMKKFNQEKCIVWGTLQMYRKGRLDFLKSQRKKAENGGYFIGFKIVRGAYMEKERERAQKMGYPSPIQPDKESTDRQYDEAMNFMLQNIDRISLYSGTHNEASNERLIELIAQYGLKKNHPKIWFGQLYGMSDNISFNLGKLGYNIAKYLPYGPIRNVVPYLTRRAEENTSVAGQTGRELSLLRKEILRRGI
ncbi:MAG: proline dehydrogenase family protein [Flavobacteriaceae bacterium]|jgi:proline dehydrogenase|nr:proline dehydrogenase family protein [Flavobacteriaceae bacterium]